MSEDLYTETANQLQSALMALNSQKLFAKEVSYLPFVVFSNFPVLYFFLKQNILVL